jgi:hypothetical protein
MTSPLVVSNASSLRTSRKGGLAVPNELTAYFTPYVHPREKATG